jgi:hypothetical protein
VGVSPEIENVSKSIVAATGKFGLKMNRTAARRGIRRIPREVCGKVNKKFTLGMLLGAPRLGKRRRSYN